MRRLRILIVLLTLPAAALTGCSLPTIVGGDGATSGGGPLGVESMECDGRDLAISAGDGDYRVSGVCPRVHIDGSDLDIDLEGAEVGMLVVRGDGNDIEAGDVGDVQIAGQDNDVEATSIDVVSIRGDRNSVDSEGTIGSVRIQGNDNDVEGQAVGAVVDDGQGNTIDSDD